MNLAADHRSYILEFAKGTAITIARSRTSKLCTIDDVQAVLIQNKMDLGMAAGSVFKGDDWEYTGQTIKTKRASSHARDVKVWKLK